MNPESLLAAALLGITLPREVEGIEFSKENRRLDIKSGFGCGTTFACPVFGTAVLSGVYLEPNIHSVFKLPEKLSATLLFQQSPLQLMLLRILCVVSMF